MAFSSSGIVRNAEAKDGYEQHTKEGYAKVLRELILWSKSHLQIVSPLFTLSSFLADIS
jgi:hypothetical protein